MPEKLNYLLFHYAARIFGSLFFPLFSGYGENEFKPGRAQIIFCRNHGFITLLNLLRFFTSPVVIVARENESSGLIWRLLKMAGLKIHQLKPDVPVEAIEQLLCEIQQKNGLPVYLISADKEETDQQLPALFAADKTLFFAVSGCKKLMSCGFIPVVREMKALCVSMPVYCSRIEQYQGLKELEFLENSLEKTPQFELPTFFHTHQKFS